MNDIKILLVLINIFFIFSGFILVCISSFVDDSNLIFIGAGIMFLGVFLGTYFHYKYKKNRVILLNTVIDENNLRDELMDCDEYSLSDNNSLKSDTKSIISEMLDDIYVVENSKISIV